MSNDPQVSSQSVVEEEGVLAAITGAGNNNQFRKDFPENALGVDGNYRYRGDQTMFELEGAEPMGTRNVPRCLTGDFETEFNRRDAFAARHRIHRFWKASPNLDDAGDRNGEDAWMMKDGKPILLRLEKLNVEEPLTGAGSLHALLDQCYSEPDPKHRRKRVQKLRDEHPEIYQEHFGDDVTNDRVTERKSKTGRHRCQIQ